jgi:predicted transcriptional regulator
MVTKTSKQAFQEMLEDKQITKQEHKILSILDKPMTSREIVKHTDMERSSVCGRLNGLCKKNIVTEYDIVTCSITHKQVHRYSTHKYFEARKEIETIAGMDFDEIVTIYFTHDEQYNIKGADIFKVLEDLKFGFIAIPF